MSRTAQSDTGRAATLVIENLHARRGSREILRGVDLSVAKGEVCALMGSSGAGKTTVLRAVAALEPFTAGRIVVDGAVLAPGPLPSESRLRALRSTVGMVFQGHSLFEHLTALENVMLAPLHARRWPQRRAEEAGRALLAELGVGARVDAYPRELSGGEAQRVAIARALVLDPVVLLLDEPTSALDPARRTALSETLRALARAGRGLLLTTHDVDLALAAASHVAILADGAIVDHGPARDVLVQPTHPATRELLSATAGA